MEKSKENDYYTVAELADRWQVTVVAVRNWIAEGAFPNAYKVGPGKRSHLRVPVEDVVAFERSRKVRP